MAVTRRKVFVKTRQRRSKPSLKGWSSEAPVVAAPPDDRAPLPTPPRSQRNSSAFGWRAALKLLLAVGVLGYGAYFLVTSKPGRDVYLVQKVKPPPEIPAYPGHRPATGTTRETGVHVEHSLADRLPPTDQSFVDTFGRPRISGQASERAGGGSGGAGISGELPDSLRLRENVAGNCDIGSNGSGDIANCLRRNSIPGK